MSICPCATCLHQEWVTDGGPQKEGIEAFPPSMTRMIVCETCGNKRCPHATDHEHACTASNASGQPGSRYGTMAKAIDAVMVRWWRMMEPEAADDDDDDDDDELDDGSRARSVLAVHSQTNK